MNGVCPARSRRCTTVPTLTAPRRTAKFPLGLHGERSSSTGLPGGDPRKGLSSASVPVTVRILRAAGWLILAAALFAVAGLGLLLFLLGLGLAWSSGLWVLVYLAIGGITLGPLVVLAGWAGVLCWRRARGKDSAPMQGSRRTSVVAGLGVVCIGCLAAGIHGLTSSGSPGEDFGWYFFLFGIPAILSGLLAIRYARRTTMPQPTL